MLKNKIIAQDNRNVKNNFDESILEKIFPNRHLFPRFEETKRFIKDLGVTSLDNDGYTPDEFLQHLRKVSNDFFSGHKEKKLDPFRFVIYDLAGNPFIAGDTKLNRVNIGIAEIEKYFNRKIEDYKNKLKNFKGDFCGLSSLLETIPRNYLLHPDILSIVLEKAIKVSALLENVNFSEETFLNLLAKIERLATGKNILLDKKASVDYFADSFKDSFNNKLMLPTGQHTKLGKVYIVNGCLKLPGLEFIPIFNYKIEKSIENGHIIQDKTKVTIAVDNQQLLKVVNRLLLIINSEFESAN